MKQDLFKLHTSPLIFLWFVILWRISQNNSLFFFLYLNQNEVCIGFFCTRKPNKAEAVSKADIICYSINFIWRTSTEWLKCDKWEWLLVSKQVFAYVALLLMPNPFRWKIIINTSSSTVVFFFFLYLLRTANSASKCVVYVAVILDIYSKCEITIIIASALIAISSVDACVCIC